MATADELRPETLQEAIDSDPLYKVADAQTALRLESNGIRSLLGESELYRLRKVYGKPVERIYFPQGEHILIVPSERLASQGGNVDWFRFWLQGYEDPDPAKRPQYVRWEALREQQIHNAKSAPT
ncbi:MAG TPA: hypothetical protein VGL66_15150 [Caulobacteraceae bacterium]|jgi:hypothetical protein